MFTTQSNYAWIIDSNRQNRTVAKIGPWNAPSHLVTLMEASNAGLEFRIVSDDKVIHEGRILGIFAGDEPFHDLNFVDGIDTIEYKNTSGYWEAIN